MASKKQKGKSLPLPQPIPDTPENVAKAIMQGPPKKDWAYLNKKKK